jgi:hypothetical protein
MTQALQAHRDRIDAMLREEAAVLARCTLLEELIVIEAAGSTSHVGLSLKRSRDELSPRSSRLTPGPGVEQAARLSPNAATSSRHSQTHRGGLAAAVPIHAEKDVKVPLQRQVPPVVIVDDERLPRDSPPCTPSEILDECELLFGRGGTSAQLSSALDASSPALHQRPVIDAPTPTAGAVHGGAKSALRIAALQKERHPRVLVAQTGTKRRTGSDYAATSHGRMQVLNRLSDVDDDVDVGTSRREANSSQEPRQTPDGFWDVTM